MLITNDIQYQVPGILYRIHVENVEEKTKWQSRSKHLPSIKCAWEKHSCCIYVFLRTVADPLCTNTQQSLY